jgi:4-diphosphocytidyl-2-C-methyl-D-erythritol kinase
VPFFVHGCPALVRGVGELLEALHWRPNWTFVVAFPGLRLSTAEVYRAYDDSLTKFTSISSIPASVAYGAPLQDFLVNDLEGAASRIYPRLVSLKRQLLARGAEIALMTGSGSAFFGVWDVGKNHLPRPHRKGGIWAELVDVLTRLWNLSKRGLDGRPAG